MLASYYAGRIQLLYETFEEINTMLALIAGIYALIGMGFAIRSGWLGGIDIAIANAQDGIHGKTMGRRVNTYAYFWDVLMWPTIAASMISEKRAMAEIRSLPMQPEAALQLKRPQ
jgi:hypothetical protein